MAFQAAIDELNKQKMLLWGIMMYSTLNAALKGATAFVLCSSGPVSADANAVSSISSVSFACPGNSALENTPANLHNRVRTLPASASAQMRDLAKMTTALKRIFPVAHRNNPFSPAQHCADLNVALDALASEMSEEVQAALPKALSARNLSASDIKVGLKTLCKQIKATPIHIGFVCEQKMFNDQGDFWPAGKYFNRPMWYRQNGYVRPAPRRFEPVDALPEHQPIYGALNLGLSGHTGWGASYFVLKPQACQNVELRSRDTGEPDGIGYYALLATRDNPLPIVADWIQMGLCAKLWAGMVEGERLTFSMTPQTNTEAAIFTDNGYLRAEDIALIVISESEANQQGVDLSQLKRDGKIQGIPVVFHDGPNSKIAFKDMPEYHAVLAAYAADAESP